MSYKNSPVGPGSRFAQFKLVLLGETAVGKSSVVHRFVKNTFDDMRESTIGAAFLTQSVTLPENNTTIKFEIWDTAGQERYKTLAPMYYRNAHAALCVYDITSRSSFIKAQEWIDELSKQAPEGIIIYLAGNKLDLAENREVEAYEVEQYAEQVSKEGTKILSGECSAKSSDGVSDIFYGIARQLPLEEAIHGSNRSRQAGGRRSGGLDLSAPANTSQQNSCC